MSYCTISNYSAGGVTWDAVDEIFNSATGVGTCDTYKFFSQHAGLTAPRNAPEVPNKVEVPAMASVTWDNRPISATSTGPVTRDGRTIRNGTVFFVKICPDR